MIPIANGIGPQDHGAALKSWSLAGLRGSIRKQAFVPSPETQQRVQAAAQAGQVQQVQQDPNANAVSPGGVTIDDVVGMLEQMHSEISQGLVTIQNAISEMRAALPTSSGGGGSSGGGESQSDQQIKSALERVAQLEQMFAGMNAQQAQGAQAAQPAQPQQ